MANLALNKAIAVFEFDGIDALGPNENVTNQSVGDVSVKVFRRLRSTPLLGMKQPLFNHAIMGHETVIEILVGGMLAISYRWRLASTKHRQIGVVNGVIDGIIMPFSDPPIRYKLHVFSPRRGARSKPSS